METAVFPVLDLFGEGSSDSEGDRKGESDGGASSQQYVENVHCFPGVELVIREFDFHPVNANLVWPGTASFASWLLEHRQLVEGKRGLEIGSGTGILSIFLAKALHCDVTTSDYDDAEIEENISHNFKANGLQPPPHLRHTWGTPLEEADYGWEVLVASDILLYVKQYENLIRSLRYLLTHGGADKSSCQASDVHQPTSDPSLEREGPQLAKEARVDVAMKQPLDWKAIPHPYFLMSWRRRIPKEDEAQFFEGCKRAGLFVKDVGPRIYCITKSAWPNDGSCT